MKKASFGIESTPVLQLVILTLSEYSVVHPIADVLFSGWLTQRVQNSLSITRNGQSTCNDGMPLRHSSCDTVLYHNIEGHLCGRALTKYTLPCLSRHFLPLNLILLPLFGTYSCVGPGGGGRKIAPMQRSSFSKALTHTRTNNLTGDCKHTLVVSNSAVTINLAR